VQRNYLFLEPVYHLVLAEQTAPRVQTEYRLEQRLYLLTVTDIGSRHRLGLVYPLLLQFHQNLLNELHHLNLRFQILLQIPFR
jgi:hypothetical protein